MSKSYFELLKQGLTVIEEPDHVFRTGATIDTVVSLVERRGSVTILHKHSSLLTCRGADHVVILPTLTSPESAASEDGGQDSSNR